MNTKLELFCFPNGNTAFCKNGKQVRKVQLMGWLTLQLKWLEECGYNPADVIINMPNTSIAKAFKTSDGKWSWEIV